MPVVLLSQMIRTAAITGRTDSINAWFAGRQGGRWAQQMVRRELTDLRRRGVLTVAEFESLRADLCV